MDLFAPRRADLRDRPPVHRDDRTGLWLVSRHRDVRAVLADQRTYRPDNALTAVTPIPPDVLRSLARARFALPPTLANNATATHPRLRRLVARHLTRSRVAALEPFAVARAASRLDALTGPEVDLHPALARDLPAEVLLAALGLDDVDVPALKAWSGAALELFWGDVPAPRQAELAGEACEFHRWIAARIATATGDGLLGALRAEDVPPREATALCFFLLVAGQETTTQLLASAFHALLPRGDLWARLAEPGFAERCVEEVLRRDPPVTTWRRVTARPVRLSGVDLPEGAHLLLMLAATGSDPEVFADPERLCPARPNAGAHLAFGHGAHFCLGAPLARMEAAVVLRETARRFPRLRLADAGEPPVLGLLSFRAPLEIRVVLGERG
ncbi:MULTISPECIES: cytochrome P450 [Actinosynnema]|uniref:cytochrome P450 n=1 Tax=Actinosynnema TaxID=40566 RepID=UPI0020A4C60F|nr:cytochrome P450 [Actinosynnema pretiosum]MCP2094028.1 Cytochrome P450 [Actinosynnema pretiosum]